MSKHVSISKKIAAGLMAGLMLGSFVPAQAGLWGRIKHFGNNIARKVDAINFDVHRFWERKFPFPMNSIIHLGRVAACLVVGGTSIHMGLNILKNSYGLSTINQVFLVESLGLIGFGAIFRARAILIRRYNYVGFEMWLVNNAWRYAAELEPSIVPGSCELGGDDKKDIDDGSCV